MYLKCTMTAFHKFDWTLNYFIQGRDGVSKPAFIMKQIYK